MEWRILKRIKIINLGSAIEYLEGNGANPPFLHIGQLRKHSDAMPRYPSITHLLSNANSDL